MPTATETVVGILTLVSIVVGFGTTLVVLGKYFGTAKAEAEALRGYVNKIECTFEKRNEELRDIVADLTRAQTESAISVNGHTTELKEILRRLDRMEGRCDSIHGFMQATVSAQSARPA